MKWIINADTHQEPAYASLVRELDLQKQDYVIVRTAPMADYLLSEHDEFDENGHNVPLRLNVDGPVFAMGTTGLAAISRTSGWSPGFIEAPSQTQCMAAWGDHMLNHGAVTGALRQMEPEMEEFFIRPVEDLKSFPGTVLERGGYQAWRRGIVSQTGINKVPEDTEVLVAPLRRIDAEYRCIVVDGRVVTQSRYRLNGWLSISPYVERDVIEFVAERLEEWNPCVAVSIDVARTPEGLRIIETNAVSSSGFYAIDMSLFVTAIAALDQSSGEAS